MKSRAMFTVLLATISGAAFAQGSFTKAQVGEQIRRVEDGVDEFRKWAEHRGDEGKDRADSAQANGKSRRGGKTATESQKNTAKDKKDDLEGALDDLNGSTNRLRRKFDPGDKWMETKSQVERVMDDARRINEVMTRGRYGMQAERYWRALRKNINDLARFYGITRMVS
jgi:hypothetical protein